MANSLKTKLRSLREKHGLSLDKLAEKTGVSKSYLWELENRDKGNPSAEKLAKIADSLGVSLSYLIDDEAMQPSEDMAKEAFYRKYDRLDDDVKKKIENIIDMWSDEE